MQANIITADSRAASLKACDPDDFPDFYVLLKITATFSETICEHKCLIRSMCHGQESALFACSYAYQVRCACRMWKRLKLFEVLHPSILQLLSLLLNSRLVRYIESKESDR